MEREERFFNEMEGLGHCRAPSEGGDGARESASPALPVPQEGRARRTSRRTSLFTSAAGMTGTS